MEEFKVCRLEYPEYILPLLRRCKKVLSLQIYFQPELTRLWCSNEFTYYEKFSITKELFREFQNRGLNVSFETYCLYKGIDPDQPSESCMSKPKFNQVLQNCLDYQISRVQNLINMVSKGQTKLIPKMNKGLTYYRFDSTKDLRDFNNKVINMNHQNPLHYDPIHFPEEDEEDEFQQNMILQNPNPNQILNDTQMDENQDDEGESEEEEEEITTPSMKRTREYDKFNLFDTKIVVKDKTIRKQIYNSKKNNFWNSIAKEAIKPQFMMDILWLRSINVLKDVDEIRNMKIHGIINVTIDSSLAPLTTVNARTYEGKYRDVMIANLNFINPDVLINQQKVTPDILINEKKWKILRFRVDFEPKEIIWKSYQFRSQKQLLNLDFDEINLDDQGFLN